MKWMTGPVPEPPAPDDWTLDRLERRRLLAYYGGDVAPAHIAWAHHTRFQFGRWLVEMGKIGTHDR